MYRVLIVDDEPIILEGLNKIIDWSEYDLEVIAQASDGIEAMEIIGNNNIHILVTDIKMPKMDGIELIKSVRDSGRNIKCIVLSGFDDFKYVKEAALLGIENYLLKPINKGEMAQTLKSTVKKIEGELINQMEARIGISILRDNVLNRWVKGDISSEELVDRATFLNINLVDGKYAAALIRPLKENMANGSPKIQEKGLIKFSIQNICTEIISECSDSIVFCSSTDDIVIIFGNMNINNDRKQIFDLLNKCIININAFLNIPVFVSLGSIVDEYTQLHKSYDHALNLQEYVLIVSYNKIVSYEEIKNNIQEKKEIEIDLLPFQSYTASKNATAVLGYIDEIFDKLQLITGLTPAYIQNLALEILFSITGTIRKLNDKVNALLYTHKEFYLSVFKFKAIDELRAWLKMSALESIGFLSSEDEKLSPIVRKAVNYVKNNYSKDINLKLLSIDLNVNTVYLGRLFSNETGKTFTEYLNEIRIEKAKEFLLITDLKTNEISKKIGYSNANYFYTIFKKITGISPTEFKKEREYELNPKL